MAATKHSKQAMAVCKERGIANVTPTDCEVLVSSHSFTRDAITGKVTSNGGSTVWDFGDMVAKHLAKCPGAKFPGDADLIAMHKQRDLRVGREVYRPAVLKALMDGVSDADSICNAVGVSNRIIGHKRCQMVADKLADAGKLEKVVIKRDNYASASKEGDWDDIADLL